MRLGRAIARTIERLLTVVARWGKGVDPANAFTRGNVLWPMPSASKFKTNSKGEIRRATSTADVHIGLALFGFGQHWCKSRKRATERNIEGRGVARLAASCVELYCTVQLYTSGQCRINGIVTVRADLCATQNFKRGCSPSCKGSRHPIIVLIETAPIYIPYTGTLSIVRLSGPITDFELRTNVRKAHVLERSSRTDHGHLLCCFFSLKRQ